MKFFLLLSLGIFTSIGFMQDSEKDYEKLWAEVEKFEKERLPKSAYEVVETIYELAKKDKNDPQLIKSILYKSKLSAQFEDLDPAEFIKKFEKEKGELYSPAGRALFSSILGELYHSYGMNNFHRLEDRSRVEEEKDLKDVEFSSLDQIQKKSIDYYIGSIEFNGNTKVTDFETLIIKNGNFDIPLIAKSLREFILFRAIKHFSNQSSFVTIPASELAIDDEKYTVELEEFIELDIPSSTSNYSLIALEMYNSALKELAYDKERQELLDLKRLEFSYQKMNPTYGEEEYVAHLENLLPSLNYGTPKEYVYFKRINHYINQRNHNLPNESIKQKLQQAHKLLKEVDTSFGEKAVLKKQFDQLRARLNYQSLKLNVEHAVIPNQDFLVKIDYQNLDKSHLKLYSLKEEDFQRTFGYLRNHEQWDLMNGARPVRSHEIILKGSNDFLTHSTEVAIKALDHGFYILSVSKDDDGDYNKESIMSYAAFQVSSLSHILAPASKNASGVVVDRTSGGYIPGVEVGLIQIDNNRNRNTDYTPIATITTDDQGKFSYTRDDRRYRFRLSKDNDVYLTKQGYNYYGGYDDHRSYNRNYIYTDRAIYRPGQTVFFKGISSHVSGEDAVPTLRAQKKISVSFVQGYGSDALEKLKLVTNDYGSFSGSFSIPDEVLTGTFNIMVDGEYVKTVEVEEYKRPKIFAEFNKLAEPYKAGDTITIRGKVNAFSGSNVSNAKVSYSVQKEKVRHFWCGWGYNFNPEPSVMISSGNTVTDGSGEFDIIFNSHKQEEISFDRYRYVVHADIIDITGEVTQVSKSIFLADVPMSLDFVIPEEIRTGKFPTTALNVVNSESEPMTADIKVKAYRLKYNSIPQRKRIWDKPDHPNLSAAEYRSRFPLDQLDVLLRMEDLKETKEVLSLSKKSGDLLTELNTLSGGIYRIYIEATDADGHVLKETAHTIVLEKGINPPPQKNFYSYLSKSSYQPGDRLSLDVYSANKDYLMYYYLFKSNRLLDEGVISGSSKDLDLRIEEKHRGGLTLQAVIVADNRIYTKTYDIKVPWTNKVLQIKSETFRDKVLPGESEKHILSITDSEGQSLDAELLASMYDLSLDQFVSHNWSQFNFPSNYNYSLLELPSFGKAQDKTFSSRRYWSTHVSFDFESRLKAFGFNAGGGGRMYQRGVVLESNMMMAKAAPASADGAMMLDESEEDFEGADSNEEKGKDETSKFSVRENLNETVFFYPQMEVENGKVTLEYKNNEALTKWKLMLFAHTKDLQFGQLEHELITQKPLIVEPHLPRFVRQGDTIFINAKVSNLSADDITVNSILEIEDAFSELNLEDFIVSNKNYKELIKSGESKNVEWKVALPVDFIPPLLIRIKADAGSYADGEQSIVPILSNRKLVTESMVMHLPAKSDKTYSFKALDKLDGNGSLDPYKYSIETTSNPTWLVLKSLPSLMESDPTVSDNIMYSLYANLVAKDLLEKNPEFSSVIQKWIDNNETVSPLNKNEDLKISSLELTPWIQEAQSEEKNMKSLALVLNENNVNQKLRSLAKKLKQRQGASGGFSWCSNGRENWYVTQNILEHLGHLRKMGVDVSLLTDDNWHPRAVKYIDQKLVEHYSRIRDRKKYTISPTVIHYLYTRSFFHEIEVSGDVKKAKEYFWTKSEKQWTKLNTYQQALLGEAALRDGKKDLATSILKSLKERMVVDEENGAYWNDQAGYYWYSPSIEKQALLIEFFDDMKVKQEEVGLLRQWLLKNKQVNSWSTTKGTAAAVRAFYMDGRSVTSNSVPLELKFSSSDEAIQFDNLEHKTGYNRKNWTKEEINEEKKQIVVSNPNDHLAWGSAYFQYFEDLDAIENFEDTPLKLDKKIYRISQDENGEILEALTENDVLNVGDKVRVRIELISDRPMEFLQMKDMRSSGLEPFNVLSSYKWQGGLGYYESTKDAASYFYFDSVPKGSFVFEYDLYASHKGNFSNGITEIQSMYAPEFSSHSEGVSLSIR